MLFCWIPIQAIAATDDSAVGVLLQRPIGARAAALGEAYTAADDDVLGIHYNPAITLKSKQLSMLYEGGSLEGPVQLIGFGAPFSFARFAATMIYYNTGDVTLLDNMGKTRSLTIKKDYLGTFSASASPWESLSVGGNVKILNSKVVNEFSATAYAADLGALYKASSRLNFGFAVQNLGTGLRYTGTTFDLPRIFRGGVSYQIQHFTHHLTASFDEVGIVNDGTIKESVGLQYMYGNFFAARLGYKIGYDSENLTMGFGIAFNKISVDYAYIPSTILGATSKISATLRF